MKHKSFFWFVLPSALAMLLFIFFPIVSVLVQSVHVDHEQVIKTVETCDLFGCKESTTVDQNATAALRAEHPLGQFAGFKTYTDRNHLAIDEFGENWTRSNSWRDFGAQMLNLPFYKAISFTLVFTFVVTPLVIVLGFVVAVAVNSAVKAIRGPLIF